MPVKTDKKGLSPRDAVLNILSSLDIQTVISEIYKNFELIRDYVLSNQPITKTVADLNDIVNVKRKLVSRLSSESDVIFTKRNIAEGKFGSLFASMNELKVVKTKCIEAEKYLCLADDLTEKSSKLSDLVSDVTAITDKKIPKLMSVSLADSAYMAATLLDLYGSTSLNLLSISHNLTFVYNKLYERVN